ncbi:hypothetical protein [uncultured Gammaproteobacteria bacterium]|nr:hypothetical protein [uncultured Gammaproteobacteria bacterium]CAC9587437.1 hypothetical protein [uncultured Gammaproteobacteria bacterium]
MAFSIYHHIGGLEIFASRNLTRRPIYHHIGGLEKEAESKKGN